MNNHPQPRLRWYPAHVQIGWGISFAFVAIWISQVAAASPDLYLCTTTKSTGFRYDTAKGAWMGAGFEPSNTFRIFKAPKGDKPYIVESKANGAVMFCSEFNQYHRLTCNGFGTFEFNQQNGRFIFSSTIGYVNIGPGMYIESDEKSPVPFMEIGTCSTP